MPRSPILCILLAALLLGACASQARWDESQPLEQRLAQLGWRQGEAVRSVWRVDIDGWQYLDEHHMVLGSRPGRAYLVGFAYPCRDLRFSNHIVYSTTVGALTSLDRIVAVDAIGTRTYCQIGEIHRLERAAES